MRKLLFIFLMVSQAVSLAFAAPVPEAERNNPGFFVTPGFIGITGSYVGTRSAFEDDSGIKPYIVGAYNIIQSEYGNLGLMAGLGWTTPQMIVNKNGGEFELNGNMLFGDIGLGYFTASKTINFFAGLGYSFTYQRIKLENLQTGGTTSNFTHTFTETASGLYYFIGAEYVLTKNGKWGLFALFNGRELIGNTLEINDNSGYTADVKFKPSNWMISVGLMYHF